MAFTQPPQKLSAYERMKLMDGPKVDIYVGSEKKHFRLPKLLLCHYSKYFDRCFNGPFKEGQEQKLDLKDDKVEYFESILQYMLSGNTLGIFDISYLGDGGFMEIKRCFEFIQYTDFYDLGQASVAVVEPLKRVLLKGREVKKKLIDATHIEKAFRQTPAESHIRTLIVQGVISQESTRESVKDVGRFRQQEIQVGGYASTMLLQLRECASRINKRETNS